jgi:hypothetical protein
VGIHTRSGDQPAAAAAAASPELSPDRPSLRASPDRRASARDLYSPLRGALKGVSHFREAGHGKLRTSMAGPSSRSLELALQAGGLGAGGGGGWEAVVA